MDGLCLKTAIPAIGISSGGGCGGGGIDVRTNPAQVSAVGRSSSSAAAEKKTTAPFSRFSFRYPLRSFWPGRGRGNGGKYGGMALDDAVLVENGGGDEKAVVVGDDGGGDDAAVEADNWVLKILHVRSLWREDEQQRKSYGVDSGETKNVDEDRDRDRREGSDGGDEEGCGDGCRVEEDEDDDDDKKKAKFDRDSFSRLLRRVSLSEARLYAQLSYLGNIAYCIPKIQPGNLLRCYGLRFVTSSIDKRELAVKAEKTPESAEIQEKEKASKSSKDVEEAKNRKNDGYRISASTAYEIAASTASYLHSHTRSILPFTSSKREAGEDLPEECCRGKDGVRMMNSEMASLMATTDSVTAVVAAKEEVKQAVADDLNSTQSSPCEWFVCDDDESGTRFFAIQGSESLASWQANLLFEPSQFEGLDVIVHRGIYEAAKGMYEQMLPEVRAHLKSYGDRATFRFTGHSLGGSLALLINLMLLIRNEVPISSLLPVITFGAPSIMCGGDHLLRKLGLPPGHVKAITMHRDIVPRAFSCHYPNHVTEFLKAVNGNFRNHPCLNNQNLLYAPMGDLLILQPDEKFSPSHHLLPAGIGLYVLGSPSSNANDAEKRLRAAKSVFLNSPHPLEILRDRSAYGSEGAIQRDHDMNSYLKCVRGFIRQELNRIRKAKREHRRKAWWPLVAPRGVNAGIVVGRPVTAATNTGQDQSNFSGIVQTGRDSLRRFSGLVASQHMHLLLVLLFPARLLLLGAYSVISFR